MAHTPADTGMAFVPVQHLAHQLMFANATPEHPALYFTVLGFATDNCALMSPETLAVKRRTQGLYTFYTQMLLSPKGDDAQGFRRAWLRYAKGEPKADGLNVYILVDPANSKRKKSDFTAMWVVGLGADRNYVVLDVLRDKLSLTERADRLFELVDRWKPLLVAYEEYGLQADIAYVERLQEERNFRFRIQPVGGTTSKVDRIRRLMPLFEQGRIILPQTRFRTLYDRETVNLIDAFVEEEFVAFPVAQHDDLLDCLARIEDPALRLRWPETFMSVPGSRGSELPKMTTNLNRPVRYARGHLRHRRSAQGRHPSGNDPGEQG